jgi:hypothetical protein
MSDSIGTAGIELTLTDTKEFAAKVQEKFFDATDGLEANLVSAGEALGDNLQKEVQDLQTRIQDVARALDEADSPRAFRDAQRKADALSQKMTEVNEAAKKINVGPEAQGQLRTLVGQTEKLNSELDKTAFQSVKEVRNQVNGMHRDVHAAGARTLRMFQALPRSIGGANQSIQAVVRNMTMLQSQSERYGKSLRETLTAAMFSPWGLAAVTAAIGGMIAQWDSMVENVERLGRKFKITFGIITEEAAKIQDAFDEEFIKLIDQAIGENPQEFAIELREELEKYEERISSVKEELSDLGSGAQNYARNRDEIRELQKELENLEGFMTDDMRDAINEATRGAELFGMTVDEVRLAMSKAATDGNDRLVGMLNTVLQSLKSINDESEDTVDAFDFIGERIRRMAESREKEIEELRHQHNQRLEELREQYGEESEEVKAAERTKFVELRRLRDKHRDEDLQDQFDAFAEQQEAHEENLKEMERLDQESARRRQQMIQRDNQAELDLMEARHMREMTMISSRDTHARDMLMAEQEYERQSVTIKQELLNLEQKMEGASEEERRSYERRVKALREYIRALKAVKQEQETIADQEQLMRSLDAVSQGVSAMGSVFGDLSQIMAKHGEEGLQRNRDLMFAMAGARAVASSIATFQAWMEMPGIPAPIRIGVATANAASVLTSLLAQRKQIYSNNPSSSGIGGTSGSFSGISAGALAERSGHQARMRQEQSMREDSNIGDKLDGIQESIRTQEVVLSDDTSMKNEERVKKNIRTRRKGQSTRRKNI